MTLSTIAQTLSSVQKAATTRTIDLSECIPDITANIIHDSEHFQLPSDIFEDLVFQAVNDLIDEFAQNPDKYLKPHHEAKIDHIAQQYLES